MLPGIAIVGRLDRGGTADVFEAVLTTAGGPLAVAVKRLATDHDLPLMARERFLHEVGVGATLHHPNLVRVLDVLWRDRQPFLILELLRGRSLCQLPSGATVPGAVALAIALQALEALAYLRDWRDEAGIGGLVHCDLTPGNLFLCHDGKVKLLDVGVAKRKAREPRALIQSLNGDGRIVGSLPLLSPEQVYGQPLDGRSDPFELAELAASLYLLLCGVAPWGRGGPAERSDRAPHDTVPPLDRLRPDLGADLVQLFMRALSVTPEARFADAREMLAAAQPLVTSHPHATPAGLASWLASLPPVRSTAYDEQALSSMNGQIFDLHRHAAGSGADGTVEDMGIAPSLGSGARISRYLMLDRIGQGGMGVVHAAYDPKLDRKVAIKLVRPHSGQGESASEKQAQLLQEAQALARIAHPNVTSIFDVGTFADRVYLAIELADGGTLRRWLDAAPRPWRQIVALFGQAGAGLAAAHRAGLVHRDFKPENVLLGRDGRPRVNDFGLAHRVTASEGRVGAPGLDEDSTMAGTPAYMPPEQHRGLVADARSDQFSFCASLFEALYQRLPYDPLRLAAPPAELAALLPDFPKSSHVPAWIGRILRRGLSLRPEERYPSLDALLVDLGKDPALRRRQGLAALGLVAVTAVTAIGAHQLGQDAQHLCQGAGQKLVGVWDPPTKARIAKAFRATGRANAGETWNLVEGSLDRYAQAWTAMRTEACRATRVRHRQSDAILTQRMLCLDDALRDLSALTEELAQIDGQAVDRASQATAHLPYLADCENGSALASKVKRPEDPVLRQKVAALEKRMAVAHTEYYLFKPVQARAHALEVAAAARQLGYLPLQGEALGVAGWSAHKLGDEAQGKEYLSDSILLATAAGDDRAAALSSVYLHFIVGYVDNQVEEAEWLAANVRALLERMHGDPEIEGILFNNQACVDSNRGDLLASISDFKQAIAIFKKMPGYREGNLRILGNLGILSSNLGETLLPFGRYDEASRYLKEGIELCERALGRNHAEVAHPVTAMAEMLIDEWRYQEALPYAERSMALRQHGAPPEAVADSFAVLGRCQVGLGHYATAAPLLERALALRERTQGRAHPEYARALHSLATLHRETGAYVQALAEDREALAIVEKAQGSRGIGLISPLLGAGRTYLAMRRVAAALPPLRRAVALADQVKASPLLLADGYFALAQALETNPKARRSARAAAERAHREALRAHNRPRLDEFEAWLARH